jgi:hypothetical protein
MSIFEASYTSSSYSGQTINIIIYVLFTYTGVKSHYNTNTTGKITVAYNRNVLDGENNGHATEKLLKDK